MTDLPSGWSIIPLIDVIDEIMDYRGRTPRKLGLEWGGGDIKAISARNVRMGYVDFSVEHHLASETLYRRWMTHGDMREGDVLFTTEAPLGNVATVPDGRRYVLSQRTVLMRPKLAVLDRTYFLNLLQSPVFQQTLLENATGSTALGIQRARLEKLPLVVPPLPEQQQVGQAIQDSVELIHSMERLIAKKRAIKQGMMQELLTGHTRLPGFSGDWRRQQTLSSAVTKSSGYWGAAPGTADVDGRVIRAGDVTASHSLKGYALRGLTASEAARAALHIGDVVLTASGTIGNVALIGEPGFYSSNFVRALRPKSQLITGVYLYYALQSDAARTAMDAHLGVSAMPNLGSGFYTDPWLDLPPLEEQRAIGGVLQNADDEIATLERRLEAARAIKRGMMQELLTGRTRFAEEVAA